MIKIFNNKTEKVGDDLKQSIFAKNNIDIAAAIFSIYGYECLKKQLSKIDSLRFIFTDPTFIDVDKNKREQKQFQINANIRKKSISGSDFEIDLKNELKGKAVAQECKQWIEDKVTFKSNTGNQYIQPHLSLTSNECNFIYTGINEFSSAGFGYQKDNAVLNQIIKTDDLDTTQQYAQNFEDVWSDKKVLKDVTTEVIDYIAELYKENSPEFVYYVTLHNIFNEFLEDVSEDELANEKTGFKESVIGLGKTFSALGVIKYYQERNRTVLVLCPKKLGDNWKTFLNNYEDNPLIKDRFNYDVLYHIKN